MEELLLHPKCKNINEEMQHKLDLEHEERKHSVIFEGIEKKSKDQEELSNKYIKVHLI